MATATAMYHSGKNPLHKVRGNSETVTTPRGLRHRRLHKAFLRYHDADNWPMLREALKKMGRSDLIGNGKHHLIPPRQPRTWRQAKARQILTQHTGLPPRDTGAAPAPSKRSHKTGKGPAGKSPARRGKPRKARTRAAANSSR